MKHANIYISAVVIALILCACGGKKEVKKDEIKSEPTKIAVKPDTVKTTPKTLVRPANIKTVRYDTTAQKPKLTVPVSEPTTVHPKQSVKETKPGSGVDTITAVGSAPKLVKQAEIDSMIAAKPEPIEVPDTTEDTHPCPRAEKSGIPTTALKSLLFDDIFFDANVFNTPSLTFNSNYVITLSKVVKALKTYPQVNVRLTGHTMKLGTKPERDITISQKRAITVGKLILDLFPAEEKERIARRIEINPVGSDEMLIEGDNRVKEMLNRRVSIELFEGQMTASSLADLLYKSEGTKPAIASSAPRKVEKPSLKTPPKKLTTQDMIYNNAHRFFEQKNYGEAISTFEEIINLDPKHTLADNAQWWIGESYYFQGDYVNAMNAYQKVFELGDKNKSAYAQLRIGYCYNKLNQPDLAIAAWEKVIRDYPDAVEEMTKAKKVLQITGNK